MTRFVTWLRLNIDAVVAIVIAITAVIVEFIDKNTKLDPVSNAILLVLSLLAVTLLRDRNRIARLVRETAAVRLLYGAEVDQAHALARRDTANWIYKGGTGTYLRAATLPFFLARVRAEQQLLNLRVEILDPGDEQLCEAEAQHRNSLQPSGDANGRPWTTDRIRKQSYATVLACSWYRAQSELLTIELALSAVVSTYRWDMSDSVVIMNQRGSNTPALLFERGKTQYSDLTRELALSYKQARHIPLGRDSELRPPAEPTIVQVRRLLERLALPLPAVYTDDDVAEIVEYALRPANTF
ncbi:hypothetical protein KHQ06_07445 [Nocardia tengchongensis]|uniref:Uncharacterized protein n=1 Tax=Nocardia tengchongensis TaxID=2055889 RepID=A0ABX8CXB1_9NOCA|nr:hypothetical protein [Nocardia tengchongensis]QVI22810.1 hypothetical protein KHQ06_07445 [Nocardia tengchongensis]